MATYSSGPGDRMAGISLLPPGLPQTSELQKAPVDSDGSFLIGAQPKSPGRFVRPSIQPGHAYEQPDYPTRPIDEVSGLPYCFVPNPALPAVRKQPNVARLADWDHQFPRVEVRYGANPILDDPDARNGLLNLRLQWSLFEDHHERWNNYQTIGPRQPATAQQLAATFVLGLSGYVPPIGLELKKDRAVEKRLTDEERRLLWEGGQLRVGNEAPIHGYLRRYVLAQSLDHLKESQLDEFLHTFDFQRKVYLGHALAAKIVERAVEPFNEAYTHAHRSGLLSVKHPSKQIHSRAPANPRDMLKTQLTSGRRFGRVMDALSHRLAQHQRGEGSTDVA